MKFINLHAHSGVGSPFDGFGYPQEHMDFAFENGCEGLALTDPGNMNGFGYQGVLAKKMKQMVSQKVCPSRTSTEQDTWFLLL